MIFSDTELVWERFLFRRRRFLILWHEPFLLICLFPICLLLFVPGILSHFVLDINRELFYKRYVHASNRKPQSGVRFLPYGQHCLFRQLHRPDTCVRLQYSKLSSPSFAKPGLDNPRPTHTSFASCKACFTNALCTGRSSTGFVIPTLIRSGVLDSPPARTRKKACACLRPSG